MLLKPTDVAVMMGCTVKHLRTLPIPFINIGTGERCIRRYDRVAVLEFIGSRTCQSTSGPAHPPTPTTSSSEVIDFQALLDAQRSAKPKLGKKPRKTASKRGQ